MRIPQNLSSFGPATLSLYKLLLKIILHGPGWLLQAISQWSQKSVGTGHRPPLPSLLMSLSGNSTPHFYLIPLAKTQ